MTANWLEAVSIPSTPMSHRRRHASLHRSVRMESERKSARAGQRPSTWTQPLGPGPRRQGRRNSACWGTTWRRPWREQLAVRLAEDKRVNLKQKLLWRREITCPSLPHPTPPQPTSRLTPHHPDLNTNPDTDRSDLGPTWPSWSKGRWPGGRTAGRPGNWAAHNSATSGQKPSKHPLIHPLTWIETP